MFLGTISMIKFPQKYLSSSSTLRALLPILSHISPSLRSRLDLPAAPFPSGTDPVSPERLETMLKTTKAKGGNFATISWTLFPTLYNYTYY